MQIISDPAAFQRLAWDWRAQGLRTAMVPTMGYFHQGHLSLMDWARRNADRVMVSLFVNPTQFGPAEDLASYPRDPERDTRLASEQGVDVLFMPEAGSLYAPDHATWVDVPDLARGLCARSRPTHFRGVATVVTKLLLLGLPSAAVFGEKDWQQLAIIRRMARDLNLPVAIVGRPIVREPDGLALSSRNLYLSPEERRQAPHLRKGLLLAASLTAQGEQDCAVLTNRLRTYYGSQLPAATEDYLEIVDPDSLEPVAKVERRALLALAFRLGRARLIDNILLEPPVPTL